MKNIAILVIVIFLFPVSLWAADFGLILDQSAGAGGAVSGDPAADYEASLIPRFSFLLGDPSNQSFGELIITAGITAGYENEFYCIPDLLRTELSWRFGRVQITAGRMEYTAPFAYAAEGLFDGFQFAYNGPAGIFSVGTWYTGLLNKKKANIIMTEEETSSYYTAVDYDNFSGTYFASKRMITALGWEHPALAKLLRTQLAVIAQTDLNGGEDHLHSQYVTAKIGIPVNRFFFELSGAVELEEIDNDFNIGLAGELGAFWDLPAAFSSRLSFTGYYSSGKTASGSLAAFTPVTAKFYGNILGAKPSGISVFSLDYTARLYKTFSIDLTSSYFIRNDLGTYAGYPADRENNDGYFLGNEFFAQLTWSPFSDLQIIPGGGIFLPSMGNAAPGRKPQWRIELAAVLSLY